MTSPIRTAGALVYCTLDEHVLITFKPGEKSLAKQNTENLDSGELMGLREKLASALLAVEDHLEDRKVLKRYTERQ
jgi:hypothetical protein